MSKFICNNTECSRKGIVDEYLVNTYRMINGQLVSNNAPCPCCGKIREEYNPNANVPLNEKNIEIGKYTMASSESRKEMLKKRSHDHYEKEIKPFKEHQLHEAVKQFNNASK